MNQRIENLRPSASASLMARAKELQKRDPSIISLAGGEPDFPTPERVKSAAIKALIEGDTHYRIGPGIPQLRSAIADKLRRENDVVCDEDCIIVTPGGKYAIFLAINSLVEPGDEVIILDPSWVSYEPVVIAAGGVPVHVKMNAGNSYKICREDINKVVTDKTRLIIINYPNNPSGRILHDDEAEVLESILLDYPLLYLLSDEIYEKIIFDNGKHISMGAKKSIADRVITVNGFSKCAAMTGWRVGYMACCKKVFNTAYKLYQHSLTCMSGFIQAGAVEALKCTEEMEKMRSAYQARRDHFIGELNSVPGVHCNTPEGSFYAWVQFDVNKMSSEDIFAFLLEHAKVVGVPGTAYGEYSTAMMRFSFANPDSELEEAARRIRNCFFKLQ